MELPAAVSGQARGRGLCAKIDDENVRASVADNANRQNLDNGFTSPAIARESLFFASLATPHLESCIFTLRAADQFSNIRAIWSHQ